MAVNAYGQLQDANTPPIQVGEELLERAAVFALSHREPDRIRATVYHVCAWIRLWPDGPGKEAAKEQVEAIVRAADRLCLFPGGADASWTALAQRCRALADFLREARQAGGGA